MKCLSRFGIKIVKGVPFVWFQFPAPSMVSAAFMPLISSNWFSQFTWRGEGDFPESQALELQRLVAQTHAEGRRLRFWATPDEEAVWRELRRAGVDLIGTDDLQGLASFLASED